MRRTPREFSDLLAARASNSDAEHDAVLRTVHNLQAMGVDTLHLGQTAGAFKKEAGLGKLRAPIIHLPPFRRPRGPVR